MNKYIKNLKVIYFIILISSISPVWSLINGYSPKHDSFLHAQILTYISESLIQNNQYPLWLPQVSNGIPIIFYDLIFIGPIEGFSILTSIILRISDLNLIYVIYSIISNIFLSAFFLTLLNLINGLNRNNLIITTIFILTMQPLYQFSYNFKIIILFVFITYFLFRYIKQPSFTSLMNIGFSTIIMGLHGQTIYHTVMILYVIIPIILTITVINYRLIFQYKEKKSFYSKKNILFYIVITSSFYLLIKFYYTVNDKFQILIPGRSENGKTSFENAISHGGFIGIDKFLTIFGKNQIDLNLVNFTGCIIVVYIFLEMIQNFKNIRKDPYLIYIIFLISWIIILTFPVPFVIKLMHQFMPGFAYIRHLSYFSVLLIPLIFILFSIISKYMKSKINVYISIVIGSSIQWLLNPNLKILAINVLVIVTLYILQLTKKNKIVFVVFCLTYMAQWFNTTNFNYLSRIEYTKEAIKESEIRIDPEESASLKALKSSRDIGTLSTVITLFNNEDYCRNYSNWQNPNYLRVDFMLKNIYQNHPELWSETNEQGPLNLNNCGKRKIYITNEVDGERMYQKFSNISSYSRELVIQSSKLNENRVFDLIYQDAFYPFWRAEVNGLPVKIIEDKGYKKISSLENYSKVRFYIDSYDILQFYLYKTLNLASLVLFILKILRLNPSYTFKYLESKKK